MKQFSQNFIPPYRKIFSFANLFSAWREFQKGKRNRKDVEQFSVYLMDNIFSLHTELSSKTYKHGSYYAFKINDPKSRDIHKASVRDRVVHHAIYKALYPFLTLNLYLIRIPVG